MRTLDQLRSGVARAWDTISEGWRELADRAGNALTRFHLPRTGSGVESREDRIARDAARWGILAAEISLDDDAVRVSMEVPGMEREDFDIHVDEDLLLVRGERKVEQESTQGRYYVMERAYGHFERAIGLPVAVDEAGTEATYKRGVLHVTLPRRRNAKVKRIKVTAA